MLFRVKNLTFLGVMEDAPSFFGGVPRFVFGERLRVLLLGKGRYFKEGKGESERASGIGRAFRKNSSGEYFIFSQ